MFRYQVFRTPQCLHLDGEGAVQMGRATTLKRFAKHDNNTCEGRGGGVSRWLNLRSLT